MKKVTKRLFSLALAVILLMSMFTFSSYAVSADIAVSVDKESCLQGDSIVATVYFPATYESAAALDFELNYDKAKLEIIDIEKNVEDHISDINNKKSGTLRIATSTHLSFFVIPKILELFHL